jgi:hypothetical protein
MSTPRRDGRRAARLTSTFEDVAALLGCSKRTIHDGARLTEIPHRRPPGAAGGMADSAPVADDRFHARDPCGPRDRIGDRTQLAERSVLADRWLATGGLGIALVGRHSGGAVRRGAKRKVITNEMLGFRPNQVRRARRRDVRRPAKRVPRGGAVRRTGDSQADGEAGLVRGSLAWAFAGADPVGFGEVDGHGVRVM